MAKNAIIFGATSGIGKELAKLFAGDGYNVLITGRRIERLKELQKENPNQYTIREHDVTNVDDTDLLFKELPSIFDKVDLIVHNSGIMQPNFKLEWEKDFPTLQTNVVGATKIYQLAYNYLATQGYGHLVGITSIASIRGNRQVAAYHASKAYQSSYLESLYMKAKRTKRAKIAVTNILPGYVDTDIIKGPTFWMAPLDKATRQIYKAIRQKKRKAHITKRWGLIAFIMKIAPPWLYMKMI